MKFFCSNVPSKLSIRLPACNQIGNVSPSLFINFEALK